MFWLLQKFRRRRIEFNKSILSCSSPIVVAKFGGSVLRTTEDLRAVARQVRRDVRAGRRVVAVVSAFYGETDRLEGTARRVSDRPDPASVARLLATGEAVSAALLSMQLNAIGFPAVVVDPHEIGLVTKGPRLNASPVSVDRDAVNRAFGCAGVVVVSGFVGRYEDGSPTLLGRGGSDTTALFLAHALDACECRLVKDVDGLYPEDPAHKKGQRPYAEATWQTALARCGALLQEKALRYAQSRGRPFRVCALAGRGGTWIGADRDRFAGTEQPEPATPGGATWTEK